MWAGTLVLAPRRLHVSLTPAHLLLHTSVLNPGVVWAMLAQVVCQGHHVVSPVVVERGGRPQYLGSFSVQLVKAFLVKEITSSTFYISFKQGA